MASISARRPFSTRPALVNAMRTAARAALVPSQGAQAASITSAIASIASTEGVRADRSLRAPDNLTERAIAQFTSGGLRR